MNANLTITFSEHGRPRRPVVLDLVRHLGRAQRDRHGRPAVLRAQPDDGLRRRASCAPSRSSPARSPTRTTTTRRTRWTATTPSPSRPPRRRRPAQLVVTRSTTIERTRATTRACRDLQPHRECDQPRHAGQRPDVLQRCDRRRADDPADRHDRAGRRTTSSRTRPASAPILRPDGPDQRRRLVQRRRRGRPAPRHGGIVDVDRPDRRRPRHRVGHGLDAAPPTTRLAPQGRGHGAADTNGTNAVDSAVEWTASRPTPRRRSAGTATRLRSARRRRPNGATGVALGANVSITFSEPVDVDRAGSRSPARRAVRTPPPSRAARRRSRSTRTRTSSRASRARSPSPARR